MSMKPSPEKLLSLGMSLWNAKALLAASSPTPCPMRM